MPPKSPQPLQVIQSYVDYLNGLFNRLLTDSRLVSVSGPARTLRNISGYQAGARVPLLLSPAGSLFFDQLVQVVDKMGGQSVRVLKYTYIFSLTHSLDDWMFRFEYDREPSEEISWKPHAHVHLNARPDDRNIQFDKVHLPTGRISVEHLIAHLVHEWGVEPKIERSEALGTLRDSYAGYLNLRTDLSGEPVIFP